MLLPSLKYVVARTLTREPPTEVTVLCKLSWELPGHLVGHCQAWGWREVLIVMELGQGPMPGNEGKGGKKGWWLLVWD